MIKIIKLRYRGHNLKVYGAWFLRIEFFGINRAFRLTKDVFDSDFTEGVQKVKGRVNNHNG